MCISLPFNFKRDRRPTFKAKLRGPVEGSEIRAQQLHRHVDDPLEPLKLLPVAVISHLKLILDDHFGKTAKFRKGDG